MIKLKCKRRSYEYWVKKNRNRGCSILEKIIQFENIFILSEIEKEKISLIRNESTS
jgi:hypothetical protein